MNFPYILRFQFKYREAFHLLYSFWAKSSSFKKKNTSNQFTSNYINAEDQNKNRIKTYEDKIITPRYITNDEKNYKTHPTTGWVKKKLKTQ